MGSSGEESSTSKSWEVTTTTDSETFSTSGSSTQPSAIETPEADAAGALRSAGILNLMVLTVWIACGVSAVLEESNVNSGWS